MIGKVCSESIGCRNLRIRIALAVIKYPVRAVYQINADGAAYVSRSELRVEYSIMIS